MKFTFIDVETDSFQLIITRMAFTPVGEMIKTKIRGKTQIPNTKVFSLSTPVSSVQIMASALNARVPHAALVQVSEKLFLSS